MICPVSETLTNTENFGEVTSGKVVTKAMAGGCVLGLAVLCKGYRSHLDPKGLC